MGLPSLLLAAPARARPTSANGMVRPCSGPASMRSWQGALKTRSKRFRQPGRAVLHQCIRPLGKSNWSSVRNGFKLRRTQREQMSSGLPLIADIDGFSDVRDRHQNIDALKPDKKVIRSRTPFGKKGAKVEQSPRAEYASPGTKPVWTQKDRPQSPAPSTSS